MTSLSSTSEFLLNVASSSVGVCLLLPFLQKYFVNVLNVWSSSKIEEVKAAISKKVYVSKIRFDTEFQIYRELSAAFYEVKEAISVLIPTQLDQRQFADQQCLLEEMQKRYSFSKDVIENAHRILGRNMAFIQESIFKTYKKILAISEGQIVAFNLKTRERDYRNKDSSYNTWPTFEIEVSRRTQEISDTLENVNRQIREYLSTLDILK